MWFFDNVIFSADTSKCVKLKFPPFNLHFCRIDWHKINQLILGSTKLQQNFKTTEKLEKNISDKLDGISNKNYIFTRS